MRGATTVREQLAKHRADVSCAGYHAKLDPHGFALESFDVVGGYRTNYRVMSKTGTKFPGVEHKYGPEAQSSDELPGGLTFADRPVVDAILADVSKNNYGFRTPVLDVLRSPLFAAQ